MSTDNRFDRGSKDSSSIMAVETTPEQVEQFMKTSFYLPVDILKNRDWLVGRIMVITGEEFSKKWFMQDGKHDEIHCVEAKELLFAAQFVAVSQRYNFKNKNTYYVCKIWYGKEPQS